MMKAPSQIKVGDIVEYSGMEMKVIRHENLTEKYGRKDDMPVFGVWGIYHGGNKGTFNYLISSADRFDGENAEWYHPRIAYLQGNDRARFSVQD